MMNIMSGSYYTFLDWILYHQFQGEQHVLISKNNIQHFEIKVLPCS